MKGYQGQPDQSWQTARELEIRGLSLGFPDCLREETKTFILLPEERFPKLSTEEWVMKAELTSFALLAAHLLLSTA